MYDNPQHYHFDQGFLTRCWHRCRVSLGWRFWTAVTFSFPVEHALWEHLPPFSYVARLLGL